MSQFEFVSVGLALVYSFAIARLLAALPFALARDKRYWIHLIWFGVTILALVVTWWNVWLYRNVAWNPIRFVWALSIPSLIYLRAGALVSQSPATVASWRDHYFRSRIAFFTIGLAIAVNGVLLPWIMGLVRWFTPSPPWLAMPLLLFLLYVIGLATDRPRVHAGLGVVNLLALIGGLLAATFLGDGAA